MFQFGSNYSIGSLSNANITAKITVNITAIQIGYDPLAVREFKLTLPFEFLLTFTL